MDGMKIENVRACVFTGAGTTMQIAEEFCRATGIPYEVADITPQKRAVPAFAPGDLAVFAVPSYGGRVPAPAAEKLRRCVGEGVPAVLIVSYGNRAVDDTFLEMADVLGEGGFVPVALGSFVAHHSLMTNVAEGRPDADDLAAVRAFAAQVVEKLARADSAEAARVASIPGSRPYRTFGGVVFKPEADADECTTCGLCVRFCPTGAITFDDTTATDVDRCISCFRCVAVCPAGARTIGGGAALTAAREAFAQKCAVRQEPWTCL